MAQTIKIDQNWEYWALDLMGDIVPKTEEHFCGDECWCKPSINKFVTHLLDREKEWFVFSHNPKKKISLVPRDSFLEGLYQKNSFMNDVMAKNKKMWDDHEDMHGGGYFPGLV